MDTQTVTLISAAITLAGTAFAGWLGFRAKQAESRINAQSKAAEVAAGTTLNERQEAAAIRQAQREEIKELRSRLDEKDRQIDDLQDAKRSLESKAERLEATVERLQATVDRLERELLAARGGTP